jgi:hypothetical protein
MPSVIFVPSKSNAMFSDFSWWQFTAAMIIGSLIYYPVILWLYYKKEIAALFARATSQPNRSAIEEETADASFSIVEDSEEGILEQTMPAAALIADLMQEVKTGVRITIDTKGTKDQLLSLLKSILSRYSNLKSSPQRVQLNEFIIEECKSAKVFLSMAQVYGLWTSGNSAAAK